MTDLSVSLGDLVLSNPVITASGTFGYGLEYEQLYDLDLLGGIVVKGLSPKPRKGNAPPRIIETPCGMLNSIGLANIGVETFIEEKLPLLSKYRNVKIIANVYGHSADEYAFVAARLAESGGVHAIELNLSCPNVKEGGIAFGTDPDSVESLTASVRKSWDAHMMVKLTPNVTDITKVAIAAERGGADSISLINTLTGMAIDLETRRPVLGGVTGGLSGPAIKPVALRMVHQAAKAVSIPVVGIGGISNGRDALEFIMAGATAIQVGTANFTDPSVGSKIPKQMNDWLEEHNIKKVSDLIGTLKA